MQADGQRHAVAVVNVGIAMWRRRRGAQFEGRPRKAWPGGRRRSLVRPALQRCERPHVRRLLPKLSARRRTRVELRVRLQQCPRVWIGAREGGRVTATQPTARTIDRCDHAVAPALRDQCEHVAGEERALRPAAEQAARPPRLDAPRLFCHPGECGRAGSGIEGHHRVLTAQESVVRQQVAAPDHILRGDRHRAERKMERERHGWPPAAAHAQSLWSPRSPMAQRALPRGDGLGSGRPAAPSRRPRPALRRARFCPAPLFWMAKLPQRTPIFCAACIKFSSLTRTGSERREGAARAWRAASFARSTPWRARRPQRR